MNIKFLGPICAFLAFANAPLTLADDITWNQAELYQKGRTAYDKEDWRTALTDFTAFKNANEATFNTNKSQAVSDLKQKLDAAIVDCSNHISGSPGDHDIIANKPFDHDLREETSS